MTKQRAEAALVQHQLNDYPVPRERSGEQVRELIHVGGGSVGKP